MACGVNPTCPITAIPASTIAFAAVILEGDAPSNFIASIPPSFRILTAESTACLSFKLPYHKPSQLLEIETYIQIIK